jgi:hypothetical protein
MSIVKYSTSNVANTIRANNVAVGINNVNYGPTDTTGFYSGINVPSGGYVIYRFPGGAGLPNVYVAQNDTELINLAGRRNATTITEAISHINGLSNTIIINRNYENIVTDGLIICLDAGTLMSYLRSGTTWRDISGNGNNGTLTNGPTFDSGNGGNIVFDGSNDFISIPGSTAVTTATLLIWVYRNGAQPNYAGLFYSRGFSANGIGFYSTTNNLSYTWNNSPSTYNFSSNLNVPNLQWSMCAVSISATNAVLYVGSSSGLLSATNNVSNSPTTMNAFRIASDAYWAPFRGSVSNAMFYNRALSQAEILQNFNNMKGRFGL